MNEEKKSAVKTYLKLKHSFPNLGTLIHEVIELFDLWGYTSYGDFKDVINELRVKNQIIFQNEDESFIKKMAIEQMKYDMMMNQLNAQVQKAKAKDD